MSFFDRMGKAAPVLKELVEKMNPNHDPHTGRFTSKSGQTHQMGIESGKGADPGAKEAENASSKEDHDYAAKYHRAVAEASQEYNTQKFHSRAAEAHTAASEAGTSEASAHARERSGKAHEIGRTYNTQALRDRQAANDRKFSASEREYHRNMTNAERIRLDRKRRGL